MAQLAEASGRGRLLHRHRHNAHRGDCRSDHDLARSRTTAFRELIANGKLPAGYATEDGTGLLYAGTELLEAVTILPGRRAWHVTPDSNGRYAEQAIIPRLITADQG
jgi:hypothetical protein